MKKKARKLTLNRETLRFLDLGLKEVVGADTYAAGCATIGRRCTGTGDTGISVDPTICQTCYECSNGCATGGACTVSCP
jgi:hypothetical protein